MKTIKFNTNIYELVDLPNVLSARFQATIKKGDYDYDSIFEDIANPDEIIVYNDDMQVIGAYSGYSDCIATSVYANGNISVELLNSDVEAQIDTLTSLVDDMQSKVNDKLQSSVIGEVESINGKSKNPYSEGDTFMGDDGNFYKASAEITTNNILTPDGNIERTSIVDAIKKIIDEKETAE